MTVLQTPRLQNTPARVVNIEMTNELNENHRAVNARKVKKVLSE